MAGKRRTDISHRSIRTERSPLRNKSPFPPPLGKTNRASGISIFPPRSAFASPPPRGEARIQKDFSSLFGERNSFGMWEREGKDHFHVTSVHFSSSFFGHFKERERTSTREGKKKRKELGRRRKRRKRVEALLLITARVH